MLAHTDKFLQVNESMSIFRMLNKVLWVLGIILVLAYAWSSSSCATIGSPGGGGKDTLAPSVI